MVVDTSVLIAVLRNEAEAEAFAAAIAKADRVLVGAPTLFETRLVLINQGSDEIEKALDDLVAGASIQTVGFEEETYRLSTEAFRRFGKGRHPARLNFGDCMAYAVSRATGEPLLFKGNDFSQTDVKAHPASVSA